MDDHDWFGVFIELLDEAEIKMGEIKWLDFNVNAWIMGQVHSCVLVDEDAQ